MGLPPQLEQDLNALKDSGYLVKSIREPPDNPRIFIIFENYPLPDGWKEGEKNETQLLLITDISYPNSKLDMFWTDVGVHLVSGKIPQNGEVIEEYVGQKWRRFSWHCSKWNPAVDNIITYLETVNERLRQRV